MAHFSTGRPRARSFRVQRLSPSFQIPNSKFPITAFTLLFLSLSLSLSIVPAAEAVRYRFTFPEPEHHWMQVEVTFSGLPSSPLELRMSRSSPGRYSLHEFAKNVYDVDAFDDDGRRLEVTRPDPYGWTVPSHDGTVIVRYKVFGDRVDGTYLAIDPTHAHINMPAAILWARGLEEWPATLAFEPPTGVTWRVVTQLFPGSTPFEFTAPNLHYLMDSPVEFGPGSIREFRADGQRIRVAVHHAGTDGDLNAFVRDVERIVVEQREVFGEYPSYENGTYTFIADYLPYASGDGMEHRNSTVLTSTATLATSRLGLLETVSHEFFHGWNVERIRPRSLEPFDFDRANMSGELWLGEGFTEYYGSLVLHRAGLTDVTRLASTFGGLVGSMASHPARLVRSAEEMSRMAAFTDGGRTVDRTNWYTTVISYYPFGGAIALALDLTLRERSGGKVSLDDYMRALWRVHGKPGGSRPGHVDRPYTMTDAEARLAEVSGDPAFARDFFRRFISGNEAPDFARLLATAGFALQRVAPGRAWLGDLRLDERGGSLRVASAPLFGSPAYLAGLDLDDEIRLFDKQRVTSFADVARVLERRRPGDVISVEFVNRTGVPRTATIKLDENPAVAVVPVEATGRPLTPAERAFRERWLN